MNQELLAGLIRTGSEKDASGDHLVFDFSERSDAASFYNDQFSDNEFAVETVKDARLRDKAIPGEMLPIVEFAVQHLPEDAVIVELGGSYLQHRSGDLYQRFRNYFPLDISYSSMQKYSRRYNRASVVANAEQLPFKDGTVDCILTHTFMEHTYHPEKVLAEVDRVLRKGGYAIHCDAWNCRWWQRFGIVGIRPFSTLTVREKLIYLAAKATEFPLFRKPVIILRRVMKIGFNRKRRPIDLPYKRLKPNYSLHLYCDEDAASSIDPVDVIRFYESRGFGTVKKLSFANRLFFRELFIILRKGHEQR